MNRVHVGSLTTASLLCKRGNSSLDGYICISLTYIFIYFQILIYIYICVCVCVGVRAQIGIMGLGPIPGHGYVRGGVNE